MSMKKERVRDKLCEWCKQPFHDETSWAWRKTCSKPCATSLKITTARANGAYEWDDARRKLLSDSTRKAMKRRTNVFATEEGKSKIRATLLERYGVENWKQTPEGRAASVTSNSARTISVETRKKHSVNARRQMKGGLKSRGIAGVRADLNCAFRSTWEANYARVLQIEGRSWEYEPTTFELPSGITYTPDFFVDDVYVEIKGWMDDRSRRQIDEFRTSNPTLKLELIGPAEYKTLTERYASLIKEWE